MSAFRIHIVDNNLSARGFGNVSFSVEDVGTLHLDANNLGGGRFEVMTNSGQTLALGENPRPGQFIGKFRPLRTAVASLTAGQVQRITLAAYQAAQADRHSATISRASKR